MNHMPRSGKSTDIGNTSQNLRACILVQILETFSNHALKNEESSSSSPLMQQASNEL